MEEPDKKIEYIKENLDEMHIYLENTTYQEEIENPNSLIKKTPGPEVFCFLATTHGMQNFLTRDGTRAPLQWKC